MNRINRFSKTNRGNVGFLRGPQFVLAAVSLSLLLLDLAKAGTYQSHAQITEAQVKTARLEGLSGNELQKLTGILRYAAYGPQAPGAMTLTERLIEVLASSKASSNDPSSALRSNSDLISPGSGKAGSKLKSETDCFIRIPERLVFLRKDPNPNICMNQGTSLVADTETRVLVLCQDNKIVKDYDFSMGWNGTGKRKEGDEKTPLGVYSIQPPRLSKSGFFKFVGIDYPTKLQESLGYTGSNVGIHSTPRLTRCFGFLNAAIDWTNGCLAVMSDLQMDEISEFILVNDVKRIVILPLEETGLN